MEWLARWRPAATHPFRSMSRAQLWYECRAHLIVPVFIACMLPCFLFVPALDRTMWRSAGGCSASCSLPRCWWPCLPAAHSETWSIRCRSTRAASFVLVRPISSLSIVRGKLVHGRDHDGGDLDSLSGLYFAALAAAWFHPSRFKASRAAFRTWKAVGYPILVLSLLVLLTWKTMVEALWISLTGRKWVETAVSFGFVGLVFVSIGSGLWIGFHPELQAAALAAVPWLMGLLLAIKLAAAAFVVRGLLHWRLTTAGGAALMTATWLAVVFSLCALALAAAATRICSGDTSHSGHCPVHSLCPPGRCAAGTPVEPAPVISLDREMLRRCGTRIGIRGQIR